MQLIIPALYPEAALLPEVTSAVLPLPLQKKLTKIASDAIAACGAGKPQMVAAVLAVRNFIEMNMFVPCWRELRLATQAVEEAGGSLKLNEATGDLSVRVSNGKYKLACKLNVPREYPAGGGVTLELGATNFPKVVANAYTTQAREVVRRCVAGFSPEVKIARAHTPIAHHLHYPAPLNCRSVP